LKPSSENEETAVDLYSVLYMTLIFKALWYGTC